MVPTRTSGPKTEGGSSGSSNGGGDVAVVGTNGGGGGGGVGKGVNDQGTHLKKGPWTAEEDATLVEYVRKHGEGNWNAVQRNSGLARCGKSCRLRWANHLRPNLKKGAFSPEEERLIVELHAKFGNKWARMASLLPGRTDNEIKNYWNTRVKRHQRQGLPLYPADVQPQYSPGHHVPCQHQHQHHQLTQSTSAPSFTFQTQLPSPSTSNNSYTNISRSPLHYSPMAPAPTTASAGFSADIHFQNPLSPRLHHHHHNSTPTTPTSSFSFPTQQQQQLPSSTAHTRIHNTPHYAHSPTSSNPPPVSPRSPNSAAFATLPLFDLSIPRNPPVLQSPLRFKRFSSTPNLSNVDSISSNNKTTTTNFSSLSNVNHYARLSQPLSTLPSPSASLGTPMSLTGLLNSSSCEFHKELQKENQKMHELYAAVTQPEPPSSQFLPPTSQNNIDSGSNVSANVNKFDGKSNKKTNGFDSQDNNGVQLGLPANGGGLMDGIWPEAKAFAESGQYSRKKSRVTFEEEKTDTLQIEGLDGHTILLSLSPGLEPNDEAADQLNSMPDDLTNLLNIDPPPSMQAEMCADSGDTNGPSSVVTDDHAGFDLQQIASLMPTTTDHGRTLGPRSWDSLPRMC